MTAIAPHGTWKSPITAELIAGEALGLSSPRLHGDDVYWLELRPREGGRVVLVRRELGGATRDVVAAPFNVRTRVHEYGGGAYTLAGGGAYAVDFRDQRLYRIDLDGGEPVAITPEAKLRYADGFLDEARGRWVGVCEDHRGEGEAKNLVAAVDLASGLMTPLVEGFDFFAAPRMSPDGTQLAWISWNHPNMPWDGTELHLASIAADGSLAGDTRIAGGLEESIVQPQWSPDGVLHFASDKSGFWNLYRWQSGEARPVCEPVCEIDAELAGPLWQLGASTYGFASAEKIVCAYCRHGSWQLAELSTASGELRDIDTGYTTIAGVHVSGDRVVFAGGAPTEAAAIVELDLRSGRTEVLRRSFEIDIDRAYFSVPEPITFPTAEGDHAHGFFYPPANPEFAAPMGDKPPLLVKSHGGPTSASSSALSLGIQYWTSRGFAVVDVNYRGSTGYGRRYRDALRGRWGVVDVDDCCHAALYLADQKRVDPDRLAIRGGSAGGYTTLCALAFRDVFKAGASHYGVSDLTALAEETHKFESRYLDRLIGPYPERADLYRERSPLEHAARIRCPVIFLQGLEDEVVPPNQSEKIVRALEQNGVPVAYVTFEGEQHGFRKATSVERALGAELAFYAKIFGFALPEAAAPLAIANLD